MKIRAVELVGNNPITKHQATLANPKAKPGSIEELSWSPEMLEIFKTELGLTGRDLDAMGAQPIFHHPTQKVLEEAANTDEVTLSRGSTDPFDHQWYSIYEIGFGEPIPYKYSIRVPVMDKEDQIIGHQYYQLVPHHDGFGHTIERYRFDDWATPAGFPLWGNKDLNDTSKAIYVTDCPFLATQLAGPTSANYSERPVVIVAHGLLEFGYSKGDLRFNSAKVSSKKRRFTRKDAAGIIERLGLNAIPLENRNVEFFLEADWLHRPDLAGSLAILKQALALQKFIAKNGGQAIFVTPPEINPDHVPTDFAHLLARYGLIYSDDYWMRNESWPGFDCAF
jgi:hypothetical protein